MRCIYVDGVKKYFQHRFVYQTYEEMQRSNADGDMRWNTRTAVDEFGMEIGAEIKIQIHQYNAPFTFSLYNNGQWMKYRSLVFDQSSRTRNKETLSLTCMYPAAVRLQISMDKDQPKEFRIPITTANQYTLQVESCTKQENFVNV